MRCARTRLWSRGWGVSIMEATDLVAKSGAEGVFAAASPEGWGLALKISDGAGRAVAPAVLAVLHRRSVRALVETQEVTDLLGKTVGKVAPLIHECPEENS